MKKTLVLFLLIYRWSAIGQVDSISNSSFLLDSILIDVCVNQHGEVIETTLVSSSISDSLTIQTAIDNATKWKFSKSNQEKACGIITYHLKSKNALKKLIEKDEYEKNNLQRNGKN